MKPEVIPFDRAKVVLVGPMGGGKTEIAINYAISWARHLKKTVGLMDLDMVKPCFRLRSTRVDFESEPVELILPEERYGYADFPIISARMESYVLDPSRPLVVDMGGDPVGARLLGRYRGRIAPEHVHLFYVYNGRRPFSRGEEDSRELLDSIGRVCGFPITGLIHNTNLMDESTPEILAGEMHNARQLADKFGIPIQFHCIREDLFNEASKKFRNEPIFPLKLFIRPVWKQQSSIGVNIGKEDLPSALDCR